MPWKKKALRWLGIAAVQKVWPRVKVAAVAAYEAFKDAKPKEPNA